jgi:hypothetical protein
MSSVDDDEADRAFEQRARIELRRGLDQTPPELRARLDQVVDRALHEPPRKSHALRFGLPMGVAAVMASIFVVQQMRETDAPPARPAAAADDLALLLNTDLDLLEQMEFYQWLDQHPGAADGVATPTSDEAQRS